MGVFVVKYLHFCKEVNLAEHSKESLISELSKVIPEISGIPPNEVHLQYWDRNWEEYIDVEDFPQPGKIRIVRVAATKEIEEPRQNAVLEQPIHDEEGQQPNSCVGLKKFPVVYRLPKFPVRVMKFLNSGKEADQKKVRDSSALCSLMLDQISHQLQEYSNYPGTKYSLVINTLTRAYPGLKDEAIPGVPQNLNATLIRKLASKFKYLRRSVPAGEVTDVQKLMKQKYGHSSPQPQQNPDLVKRRAERPLLKLPDNFGSTETCASVEVHKQKLWTEWSSRAPSMAIIEDRLMRTMLDRLVFYDGSPDDLQKEYPMMKDHNMLLFDVKTCFGVDLQDRRRLWFTPNKIDFLLTKLKRARGSKMFSFVAPDATEEEKISCVMWMFPLLLREDPGTWVRLNSDSPCNTMGIFYNNNLGDDGISFKPNECSFTIKGLNGVICDLIPDLPSAVESLIAAYFLFNVQFNCHERTLRFLSEEVAGIPSTKQIPQSMSTLLNELAVLAETEVEVSDADSNVE